MIDTVLVLTEPIDTNWPRYLRENGPWDYVSISERFAIKNKMRYMFITSVEQCTEIDKESTAYILCAGSESNPAYAYVTSGIFKQGVLI